MHAGAPCSFLHRLELSLLLIKLPLHLVGTLNLPGLKTGVGS
jgi:hypothetical protein